MVFVVDLRLVQQLGSHRSHLEPTTALGLRTGIHERHLGQTRSGRAPVAVVQPAEVFEGDDLAARDRLFFARHRRIRAQRQGRSVIERSCKPVNSGALGAEQHFVILVRVRRIHVARALAAVETLFADQFRAAAQAQGVSDAMSDDLVVDSRPRTSSMYFSRSTPACLQDSASEYSRQAT